MDAVLTSPPEVSHIEQAASQIAGDGVPVYDVLFSEDFLGMVQSSGGKDGLKNAKQRRVLKTGSTIYLKPGIKMQKKLNAASAKVVGIMTGLGRVAEATAYSIAGAVAPPPPPQREAFRVSRVEGDCGPGRRAAGVGTLDPTRSPRHHTHSRPPTTAQGLRSACHALPARVSCCLVDERLL